MVDEMENVDGSGAGQKGTQGQVPPPPGTGQAPAGAGVPPPYGPPWGMWYYQPPVYQPPPPRRSSKPKIAGILLVFSGVMAITAGLLFGAIMVGGWPWHDIMEQTQGDFGELEGDVLFMDLSPAPGVNVTVVDLGLVARTNDAGHYRILNVDKGWHDVKVELEGYKTLVRSVYIEPGTKGSATINTTVADFQLQPGTGEQRIGESHTPGSLKSDLDGVPLSFLRDIGAVCLTLGVVLGSICILGGYFAFKKTNLPIAVGGAICGIIAGGSILAIIALILLLLSTDEFEKAKKENGTIA